MDITYTNFFFFKNGEKFASLKLNSETKLSEIRQKLELPISDKFLLNGFPLICQDQNYKINEITNQKKEIFIHSSLARINKSNIKDSFFKSYINENSIDIKKFLNKKRYNSFDEFLYTNEFPSVKENENKKLFKFNDQKNHEDISNEVIKDFQNKEKIKHQKTINQIQKLSNLPELKDEKFYVYPLECKLNKYYIGKTKNPKNINHYFKSRRSAWTDKYEPIKIIECKEGNIFDEDKMVKQYMVKYGIENVRGGSYCKITLDDVDISQIKKEIKYSFNLCFNCGQKGHFIMDCPYSEKLNINFLNSNCLEFSNNLLNKLNMFDKNKYKNSNKTNSQNNQNFHYKINKNPQNEFFKNTSHKMVDISGLKYNILRQKKLYPPKKNLKPNFSSLTNNSNLYKNYSHCSKCSRDFHEADECYAKTDVNGNNISGYSSRESCSDDNYYDYGVCFRCGRDSHYAYECYARTDIKGNEI